MLIGFEHIGMTVGDLDRSIDFYCRLLGLTLKLRKRQANGGEVAFLDAGGGQLEIIQPPGGVKSPAMPPPRTQAGLVHITLAVDDVDVAYDRLLAAGVPGIEKPRQAFNAEMLRRIAFVADPDGIPVEIVERNPDRG